MSWLKSTAAAELKRTAAKKHETVAIEGELGITGFYSQQGAIWKYLLVIHFCVAPKFDEDFSMPGATLTISMIAALDENRVIGSRPGIPWHLPRDIEYFRNYTAGKAMLIGRRTFEEMDGWFTDQRPIVVTRQKNYPFPATVDCAEAGIELAQANGEQELVISGGAQIYSLGLPFASDLLITEVHGKFVGDATFPELPTNEWNETSRERFEADETHSHAMSFVRYKRI